MIMPAPEVIPQTIKAMARERARDNANNAIASQCLKNVTADIAKQACTRVNLVANSASDNSWVDSPPASKPNADKVKYIGQGIASGAAGVNLCAMAHDLRLRTRNVVDGHCPHGSGLLPHRTFATARAWARCAVYAGPEAHAAEHFTGSGRRKWSFLFAPAVGLYRLVIVLFRSSRM